MNKMMIIISKKKLNSLKFFNLFFLILAIDCGKPPFVKNSILNYNSTHFNQMVKYSCINPKFYIEKNDFIICQSDERWSEPTPSCIEKKCFLDKEEYDKDIYNLFTSNPSMSLVFGEKFNYSIDSTVKIICSPGFVLTENYNEVFCQFSFENKSVEWNRTPPRCRKENYCPLLSPPVNGIINSDKKQLAHGFPVNTTVEFKCLFGFELKGNRYLTCNETARQINQRFVHEAKWSMEETGTCEPINTNEKFCKIDYLEADILNKTTGSFVSNESTILYSCKSNPLDHYVATCLNGNFEMQKECHEKSKINKK